MEHPFGVLKIILQSFQRLCEKSIKSINKLPGFFRNVAL